MNPTLSIIIPVYKVETYLHACIDSVVNQSFADYELILVDDGSPDNCGNICDEYAGRDSRIKVIHKKNGGLSSARNAGIGVSTGQYITFVDSDDTVSIDIYSSNMEILLNNPNIDLLEFPVYVYYNSPQAYIWKEVSRKISGKDNIFPHWIHERGYMHAYAWNKIYKRKLFKEIRFPVGKVFEDLHTLPFLLQSCKNYYISESGMYFYYRRSSSITVSARFEGISSLWEANLRVHRMITSETMEKAKTIHLLQMANMLIMMLNASGCDKTYCAEAEKMLDEEKPSLTELFTLNIPLRDKLKNITFSLFGSHIHSMLYYRLSKILKR